MKIFIESYIQLVIISRANSHSCHCNFLRDFIYLFLERGEERERNIDVLPLARALTRDQPATQWVCALNRNQTSDLSLCRTTPNQRSHTCQGCHCNLNMPISLKKLQVKCHTTEGQGGINTLFPEKKIFWEACWQGCLRMHIGFFFLNYQLHWLHILSFVIPNIAEAFVSVSLHLRNGFSFNDYLKPLKPLEYFLSCHIFL